MCEIWGMEGKKKKWPVTWGWRRVNRSSLICSFLSLNTFTEVPKLTLQLVNSVILGTRKILLRLWYFRKNLTKRPGFSGYNPFSVCVEDTQVRFQLGGWLFCLICRGFTQCLSTSSGTES